MQLHPNNEKPKEGVFKSIVQWPFRPGIGIFGKMSDGNPLTGIHPPRVRFSSNRKGFKNFDEVLADNPDFEEYRIKAIKGLRLRFYILLMSILMVLVYAITQGGLGFFSYKWMDYTAYGVILMMQVSYLFLTDVQFIVMKHRIVGITIPLWLRLRFNGKK